MFAVNKCKICTITNGVERRVSFTGHIPQVIGTGHSNCAPKRNMFLLKIYIRTCLVLLALLRLFYAVLGQILSDLWNVTCKKYLPGIEGYHCSAIGITKA